MGKKRKKKRRKEKGIKKNQETNLVGERSGGGYGGDFCTRGPPMRELAAVTQLKIGSFMRRSR